MSSDETLPPELARLLRTALDLAKAALADHDTFLPGSIAVTQEGKLHVGVAAESGVSGSNMLTTALRQKAATGQLRAAAIYRDVRVRPQGATEDVDAFHVIAELASREGAHLFQVYARSPTGEIELGQREIEQAPTVFFVGSRAGKASKRWWEIWK